MMKSFGTSPGRCFSLQQHEDNLLHSPTSDGSSTSTMTNRENAKRDTRRESNSFAYRIHEHVKLGPKLSETLKGKLSLGARIVQEGGRGNIFKHVFGMQEEEKLLKASQCYLYTTAGPIAGILFISTEKVAFCSERSTTFSSEGGELVKAPYKVLIPIGKIMLEVKRLREKGLEVLKVLHLETSKFGMLNSVTSSLGNPRYNASYWAPAHMDPNNHAFTYWAYM